MILVDDFLENKNGLLYFWDIFCYFWENFFLEDGDIWK